jgi:hypothetical protein
MNGTFRCAQCGTFSGLLGRRMVKIGGFKQWVCKACLIYNEEKT